MHSRRMMKILVLNPPFKRKFSRTSRSPGVAKGGTIYYPFWLAYAVGVLEERGFNVKLVDAPAEGLTIEDVVNKIKDFSPRLVVLDTSTPSIYSDVKAGEKLKEIFPDSFVVLVGTHPSALPEETLLLSKEVDAVARGEYDYTLRDLACALQDGKDLQSVEGLSFKQNSNVIHNPDRPLIENLDELPFVSKVYKKHLNIRNYFFAAANCPMVMIITGRGCPNRCFFCVYPQTFHSRRYRMRSAENVVDELEWIVNNLPQVKEIGIEDDTFTVKHSRVREISELIIKKGIRIKWYCNVRPDLDYVTLRLMKEAGCWLATAGFESGNQAMLDRMRKGLKLDRVREFMKNAKKAGVLVHGCIMIGNPGETKETIQESIEFAKELNCDSMQYYPLYVYPGTEAYAWAEENGYLGTTDFSQWVTEKGHHNCVINLPGLPAEELVRLADEALRDYHLRPAYLWMKLRQALKQPGEGMRTAKSAVTFIKYLWQGKSKRCNESATGKQ